MKKCILALMAALVTVCLSMELTPPLLSNTSPAWSAWNFQTARHNFYYFYFSKRQWLADARTVVAAIRFLYLSATARPANPMEVVNIPPLPLRAGNLHFSLRERREGIFLATRRPEALEERADHLPPPSEGSEVRPRGQTVVLSNR